MMYFFCSDKNEQKKKIHLTNASYKEYKMSHIELSAMDRNGNLFYRTSLSHLAEE